MKEDKIRKDFADSGISSVTLLEIKSEGYSMRRKKRDWRSEGSMQKAGPYSGHLTLMTTAIDESKKWKSG